MGSVTSLTRQVGWGESWAHILLPECSGAEYLWAGAVEEQRVEPPRHGWGLGVGQVQQVDDKNRFQQADHHQ